MDQGVGRILRRHVLNDEDGSRKIARQLTDKIIQSVQTSGGSPYDDDDVTSCVSHNASLSASPARITGRAPCCSMLIQPAKKCPILDRHFSDATFNIRETIVYLKTPPPAESFSILSPSIYWVETRLIQK
jgi:hypothetical protein